MSDPLKTAHIWGFYDPEGNPSTPAGVSISTETPYETLCRLRRHVLHFDGDIEGLKTTRTLDGWMVGAEFDVPERGAAACIWHRVMRVQDAWPDFPTTDESEEA